MNRWIFLSYPILSSTPSYGGGKGFAFKHAKSMTSGDSCNTQSWEVPNHIGTHVDVPRHFSVEGATVDSYTAEEWTFNCPFLYDISPVVPDMVIMPESIDFSGIPPGTDMLLLRTGFHQHRGQDVYWCNNPAISPHLADEIRRNLPAVRALGVDLISVSSLAHRSLGRETHKAFLVHDRPVLLIEDMDLSAIQTGDVIRQVVAAPLRVAGADGAPCTVLASLADD